MNLVLDFGNTAIKGGLFNEGELVKVYPRLQPEELAPLVQDSGAARVIVSTVSRTEEEIGKLLKSDALFFTITMPLPFTNTYETPETLGLDRLAAISGAHELFPGENCLVIDMGTCITYDLITAENNYLGGGISPGLSMRFRAIHTFTARLPEVNFTEAPQLIGRSTVSCIQSGVINGLTAELNGIVQEYEAKFDRLRIIMSGGDMNYFENTLKRPIFAAPELVLRGLNRILRHNA